MKAYRLAAAGLALGLLTGCASLLERSYTTSEPHSSKFWESEAAATLRAENRQDMVNDLLILIGQHTETNCVGGIGKGGTGGSAGDPAGSLCRGVHHLYQPAPAELL